MERFRYSHGCSAKEACKRNSSLGDFGITPYGNRNILTRGVSKKGRQEVEDKLNLADNLEYLELDISSDYPNCPL